MKPPGEAIRSPHRPAGSAGGGFAATSVLSPAAILPIFLSASCPRCFRRHEAIRECLDRRDRHAHDQPCGDADARGRRRRRHSSRNRSAGRLKDDSEARMDLFVGRCDRPGEPGDASPVGNRRGLAIRRRTGGRAFLFPFHGPRQGRPARCRETADCQGQCGQGDVAQRAGTTLARIRHHSLHPAGGLDQPAGAGDRRLDPPRDRL